MDVIVNPEDKEIHAEIGKAVEAYGNVEGAQIFLMQTLLGVDYGTASIVFFNARSRSSLIESLLAKKFDKKHKRYWASCSSFLDTLSRFRNAVVHWHPAIFLYGDANSEKVMRHEHTLIHPEVGKQFDSLTSAHFPSFLEDCRFIYQELMGFQAYLKGDSGASLSYRFSGAIARKNQALLPKVEQRTEVRSKQPGKRL